MSATKSFNAAAFNRDSAAGDAVVQLATRRFEAQKVRDLLLYVLGGCEGNALLPNALAAQHERVLEARVDRDHARADQRVEQHRHIARERTARQLEALGFSVPRRIAAHAWQRIGAAL